MNKENGMEWQPIETAPRDGTNILVCDITARKPAAGMAHFDGKYFVGCAKDVLEDLVDIDAYEIGVYDNPTHWMPLPKTPN